MKMLIKNPMMVLFALVALCLPKMVEAKVTLVTEYQTNMLPSSYDDEANGNDNYALADDPCDNKQSWYGSKGTNAQCQTKQLPGKNSKGYVSCYRCTCSSQYNLTSKPEKGPSCETYSSTSTDAATWHGCIETCNDNVSKYYRWKCDRNYELKNGKCQVVACETGYKTKAESCGNGTGKADGWTLGSTQATNDTCRQCVEQSCPEGYTDTDCTQVADGTGVCYTCYNGDTPKYRLECADNYDPNDGGTACEAQACLLCTGQEDACGNGYTQTGTCTDCSNNTLYTCEVNTCSATEFPEEGDCSNIEVCSGRGECTPCTSGETTTHKITCNKGYARVLKDCGTEGDWIVAGPPACSPPSTPPSADGTTSTETSVTQISCLECYAKPCTSTTTLTVATEVEDCGEQGKAGWTLGDIHHHVGDSGVACYYCNANTCGEEYNLDDCDENGSCEVCYAGDTPKYKLTGCNDGYYLLENIITGIPVCSKPTVACSSGYATSADDCGTQGSNGWDVSTITQSTNSACKLCLENPCPRNYATESAGCITGYTMDTTSTNGYSGDEVCYACVAESTSDTDPCSAQYPGYASAAKYCDGTLDTTSGKWVAVGATKCYPCTSDTDPCSAKGDGLYSTYKNCPSDKPYLDMSRTKATLDDGTKCYECTNNTCTIEMCTEKYGTSSGLRSCESKCPSDKPVLDTSTPRGDAANGATCYACVAESTSETTTTTCREGAEEVINNWSTYCNENASSCVNGNLWYSKDGITSESQCGNGSGSWNIVGNYACTVGSTTIYHACYRAACPDNFATSSMYTGRTVSSTDACFSAYSPKITSSSGISGYSGNEYCWRCIPSGCTGFTLPYSSSALVENTASWTQCCKTTTDCYYEINACNSGYTLNSDKSRCVKN
jgi:hypothetical protein